MLNFRERRKRPGRPACLPAHELLPVIRVGMETA